MEVEMEMINVRPMSFGENHRSRADSHACRAYQHVYEQARDHLRRAERDLAETAAFIAASLTTVTAIQAVITVANDKLELSKNILQMAFQGYVAIFLLIFLLGGVRVRHAMRRRARAEKEMDQAKKGMYVFCPVEPPAPDEKE
jgi:hypothetical protein